MNLGMIYLLFAQYGLLCFGGGYLLVPLITTGIVENSEYILTAEMFGDLVAIAQMTPGPIGLNTATFVGYLEGAGASNNIYMGLLGGVIGSVGLLTPGFFLVIFVSHYLRKNRGSMLFEGVFTGLRPASVAMVMLAMVIFLGMSVFTAALPMREWAMSLFTGEHIEWPHIRFSTLPILFGSMLLVLRWKVNVIYIILISAVLGGFFCA